MTYVLGYCGHTWELLAYRAWIVGFLAYVAGREGATDALGLLTLIAALVNLIGVPASILGAAAARRLDLDRWIGATMIVSAAVGIGLGLSPALSFWTVTALCFLYSAVVTADSATLTTGAAASARDGEMGAVLAVHSLIGFSGGFAGPILVGVVLDLGGGMESGTAWALAFAAIAAGSAGGWIAMRAVRPR